MGSVGNSDPWAPYDRYEDCSQGICSENCRQWCYLIFPPPRPSDDDSATNVAPLVICIVGILACVFLFVTLYTVISECHRRSRRRRSGGHQISADHDQQGQVASPGLEEAFINSITVYKYKKSGGVVEGRDCSVCLSEFEEGESLRLLPKCNHAFHLPCIDAWLKSNSSCPLCRFDIGSTKISPPELSEATQIIHDLERGNVGQGGGVSSTDDSTPKIALDGHGGIYGGIQQEQRLSMRA